MILLLESYDLHLHTKMKLFHSNLLLFEFVQAINKLNKASYTLLRFSLFFLDKNKN